MSAQAKDMLPIDISKEAKSYTIKTIQNFVFLAGEALVNDKSIDLIKQYENEKKIIVLRPSQDLKIARVEKNIKKLNAIYQLGIEDCTSNLDKIKKYLETSGIFK